MDSHWATYAMLAVAYLCFGCAMHFVWKALRDPDYIYPAREPGRRPKHDGPPMIYLTAVFTGFVLVAATAAYQGLYWMPEGLGFFGEDGWTSLRSLVSIVFGFPVGILFMVLAERLARQRQ